VYAPAYVGAGESFSYETLLWLMTKLRPDLATCVVCLSAPYSRYSPGERDRGVVLVEELYEPEE
jgi:hypothetical protein